MAIIAGILLAFVQIPSDAGSGVEWADDLEAACEKARLENKLVLYRQALCDCTEKACPYEALLRRPAFLDDPAAKAAVRRECVAVSARLTSNRDMEGLKDPGYGKLLTKGAPLRTFLLTPARYILHRLDFCPYSSDLSGEIDYAYMVRLTCFASDGAPDPRAEPMIQGLHEQHVKERRSYHKTQGGAPASECRCSAPRRGESGSWKPWAGYNQGVIWHTDLEEAKVLAKHSKRHLLFFQVVGDLYKEGC